MKILHLDTDDIDNPLSGGCSRKNYEIYKRISGSHEITVLTASFPGSTPEIVRDGITYRRLGRGSDRFGLSYHASYLASLPKAISSIPHDLLVEDFMPPCGSVASFLWTKKPVIGNVSWLFAKSWAKRYKIPFHLLERPLMKRYKNFIVLSPFFKQEIEKINPKADIHVLPAGIDENFLKHPVSDGGYILFFGRLDMVQKGLDTLLKSFREVRRKHSLKLVIVGDGNDRKKLETMAHEMNLGKDVEFMGRVPESEKALWYSKAKFVAMPSRFETFGIVALEAFAFGKPVVAFEIAAVNELVTDERGWPVPASDEALFTKRLFEAIEHPELLKKKSESARRFAAGFTWNKIADAHEHVFKTCARNGHGCLESGAL